MTDAKRHAKLSTCGLYRYALARTWEPRLGAALFVCLNPSTADHMKDDPTVRKCVGFAERWGYGAMWIVNLFAYRATDPKVLRRAQRSGVDIVGDPVNRRAVLDGANDADRIVLAWGANATSWGPYTQTVIRAIRTEIGPAREVWCLGLTGEGHPRHPLRLPYSTPLQAMKDVT